MPAAPSRRVNLSRLPRDKKRRVWEWLQVNKPDLAALIETPDIQSALSIFSADIIIELEQDACATLDI